MENKHRHAPGPWVVDTGKPLMVVAERGGFAVLVSMPGQLPSPTDVANAFLIAAAPDGHALLVEMAAVILAGRDFQTGPKGAHHDLKNRLRAYLAKAEGR